MTQRALKLLLSKCPLPICNKKTSKSLAGLSVTQALSDISAYHSLILFSECCSRCRFQPYDCIIIRFM